MKKFTGFLALLLALSLTPFCATAQAQYDNPDEQLYNDETPYETDDMQGEYDEQYPTEEPAYNEDDLQPDTIDPGYEDPDNELLRDPEIDDEIPPYDDAPGDISDEFPGIDDLPAPSDIDQAPLDDTGLDMPPDMMPEDSDETSGAPSGLSSGSSSQQAVSAQCAQAAGHVIFLLDSKGINSGATYLKQGARVEFSNQSNVTHRVTISPPGFFLGNTTFSLTPHSKMLMFAGSPGTMSGGSIIVNPGNSQTVHDVVICP